MRRLTAGSLFSGCGGIDKALEDAGMQSVWQVEIDKDCNRVLSRHWPETDRRSDVRELNSGNAVRPDGICAGWPCQGNSVAGKRAGLADARSGLWGEVKRILGEFRPAWFLGENVPGILSVNGGNDWLAVLRDLAELGYGFAYRILDAQWWGVPQRRRRVFVVGCLGDWRRAAEILFESDCLPWDSPPSRAEGTRVAPCVRGGIESGSNEHGNKIEWWDGSDTAPCLDRSVIGKQQMMPEKGRFAAVVTHFIKSHADSKPHVAGAFGVRRLTPRECERLQGMPDDWTRWDAAGKELSDSARYRMIGNSVALPVVRWIGRRIVDAWERSLGT